MGVVHRQICPVLVVIDDRQIDDEAEDTGFDQAVDKIRELGSKVKAFASFDRGVSYGFGGPVANDIRSTMYSTKYRPMIKSYIGGLGGRDMTIPNIKSVILDTFKSVESGELGPEETWNDLRE